MLQFHLTFLLAETVDAKCEQSMIYIYILVASWTLGFLTVSNYNIYVASTHFIKC